METKLPRIMAKLVNVIMYGEPFLCGVPDISGIIPNNVPLSRRKAMIRQADLFVKRYTGKERP